MYLRDFLMVSSAGMSGSIFSVISLPFTLLWITLKGYCPLMIVIQPCYNRLQPYILPKMAGMAIRNSARRSLEAGAELAKR